LAKEYTVCPICGLLIANEESHTNYHVWVSATIGVMQQMIDIVWEDAKLDKDKKITRPDPPPPLDY
jgi:hypothetical protein